MLPTLIYSKCGHLPLDRYLAPWLPIWQFASQSCFKLGNSVFIISLTPVFPRLLDPYDMIPMYLSIDQSTYWEYGSTRFSLFLFLSADFHLNKNNHIHSLIICNEGHCICANALILASVILQFPKNKPWRYWAIAT